MGSTAGGGSRADVPVCGGGACTEVCERSDVQSVRVCVFACVCVSLARSLTLCMNVCVYVLHATWK